MTKCFAYFLIVNYMFLIIRNKQFITMPILRLLEWALLGD